MLLLLNWRAVQKRLKLFQIRSDKEKRTYPSIPSPAVASQPRPSARRQTPLPAAPRAAPAPEAPRHTRRPSAVPRSVRGQGPNPGGGSSKRGRLGSARAGSLGGPEHGLPRKGSILSPGPGAAWGLQGDGKTVREWPKRSWAGGWGKWERKPQVQPGLRSLTDW